MPGCLIWCGWARWSGIIGDGVIEAIADAAIAKGRLRKRQRRRIMSYPLVIGLMIAMTLTPDGSYCESLARLAGLLADVPFALEWHIPTGKVVTGWRLLVPADVMESGASGRRQGRSSATASRRRCCWPGWRCARRTGCW